MSALNSDNEELYAAAVGTRNTAFYLNYFRRCSERGYAPASWNWPVFFLGFFWLAYRRLYLWAVIFMVVSLALGIVAGGITSAGFEDLGFGFYLLGLVGFQLIYLPLHANGIYYRWCGNLIQRVQSHLPGQRDEQISLISRFGGPNRPLIVIVLIAMLISASLGGSLQQIASQT